MVAEVREETRTLLDVADKRILELRSEILNRAETDLDVRTEALALARKDPVQFIQLFCFTFDPREERFPHHFPFIPFAAQVELIAFLEEALAGRHDALVEKSRDMGATWIALALILWHWLFDEGFTFLLGSRDQDAVDDLATTDSLFGRLDYMFRRLPWWMKPRGFNERHNRKHLTMVNPENGNTLTGEASKATFGRGGRYRGILLDEFGFMEEAKEVEVSTADSSPTRWFISTPDPHNRFKRLRQSGRVPVFTLPWQSHPLKDEAWYEREKARRDPEALAREVDISYAGSSLGVVYPYWAWIPKLSDFRYNGRDPLFVSWDFGLDDHTALVWYAKKPGSNRYTIVDCYQNRGKTIDFYVPIVTGLIPSAAASEQPHEYGKDEYEAILRHREWPGAIHFGDPAGKQRNQVSNSSVIQELRKHNIYVQTNDKFNKIEKRMSMTNDFLKRVEGIATPECDELIDAILNARFEERKESSQATTPARRPIHNWTSHFRTSLEYMAINDPSSRVRQGEARPKVTYEKIEW